MIKLIVLSNGQILVSKIEEVVADIGDPNCKLINPYLLTSDQVLSPWLHEYSDQSIFMISSEKILTLSDPKQSIIEKYQNLIK